MDRFCKPATKVLVSANLTYGFDFQAVMEIHLYSFVLPRFKPHKFEIIKHSDYESFRIRYYYAWWPFGFFVKKKEGVTKEYPSQENAATEINLIKRITSRNKWKVIWNDSD